MELKKVTNLTVMIDAVFDSGDEIYRCIYDRFETLILHLKTKTNNPKLINPLVSPLPFYYPITVFLNGFFSSYFLLKISQILYLWTMHKSKIFSTPCNIQSERSISRK